MRKITEKLGVPDGIDEMANIFYKAVLDNLDNIDPPAYSDKENTKSTKLIKIDVDIDGFKLKNVPVTIEFVYTEINPGSDAKLPVILSLAHGSNSNPKLDKNNVVKLKPDTKSAEFKIVLGVGKRIHKEEVIQTIKDELDIKVLGHELKHLFDDSKIKSKKIDDYAYYKSYQIGGFPKVIRDFTFLLYYTTTIENLVRPSEMYSDMIDKNITKSKFAEYLKSSEIIKNLKESRDFSFEDFINEINNDSDIEMMLQGAEDKGYNRTGDNAKDVLQLALINMNNSAGREANGILGVYIRKNQNPFSIFGVIGPDEDEIVEIANKNMKKLVAELMKNQKDPMKYFAYLVKRINFVGNKMIKKLHKLYDMAKDDTKTTSNSVLNWDLHTKINSKNEGIKYTLNFEEFKIYKK